MSTPSDTTLGRSPSATHRGGRVRSAERLFFRLIATVGVIGIGVVLGAILGSNHTAGWIMGLVVSLVTVILTGALWSSAFWPGRA